jgi:preprotein translocase subunit SecE
MIGVKMTEFEASLVVVGVFIGMIIIVKLIDWITEKIS